MTSTQQKMDDAAEEARIEFPDIRDVGVLEVAAWIKKHYMHAGYKRLCKVLMQEAGIK